MKKRIIDISVALSLVIAVVVYMADFNSGCDNIKNNVLRLHVIANSDSERDQQLKLCVRDAVVEKSVDVFSESRTLLQAKEKTAENLALFQSVAADTLKEHGCTDNVEVYLCRDNFGTREYDSYILPAGEYETLKIVIGEGQGHNWWCVMFPPLCLPACMNDYEISDVLDKKGFDVITSNPKYEVRFKIVEWIENLKKQKTVKTEQ